jgi:DNA-binding PadR family transcriptional regulator
MWEDAIRNFLKHAQREHSRSARCTHEWWAGGCGERRGGGAEGGGGSGGAGGPGGSGGSDGGGLPFPPLPGFPWAFFRKTRAKRGDVRASILSLLAEKSLNGYQIMQELEQRSRGAWRPSPGAVYPALQQLEDEGLVRAESGSSGRVYGLTDAGRAHVKEHAADFAAPWESANQGAHDETVFGLFGALKHIATASLQVVHTGSPSQIREAQKILNQARRALYHLLAEDEADDSDD